MPHKTPNLPDDLRESLHESHTVDLPGVSRFYVKAIGITILLGLVSGLLWIGWNLLRIHVVG
jgi:hypothetical protein